MRRYNALSVPAKAFVWLTMFLAVAFGLIYAGEVKRALAMDKGSYNCTSDSLMKQLCSDPYGATIPWSILGLVAYCWPVLIGWVISGCIVLIRHNKQFQGGT